VALLFTTYSELQTSVAETLNRSDLTNAIPGFIALCEADMRRRLRTRPVLGRATATLSAQYIAVPDDFGGTVAMRLTGTSPTANLQYVSPEKMAELEQSTYTSSGQPVYFTIIGDEFKFLPSPDASYALEQTYYKSLDSLSDAVTTNWMLEDHPDAYLYGACIHSAPYLKDDARIGVWAGLYSEIIAAIKSEDTQANYAGKLNMKSARVF